MKPDPSKLRQKQHEELSVELSQGNSLKKECEFTTVEEMIRFDAAQTEVPVEIAERLSASIQTEPKPPRTWWRRFFG
ncbi:MAG: hypothetical protein O2960_17835 [Verrucomicrobia bacterium]|nr:hypothetical protein [Verrucomicrobiota bacterium]